MRKRLVAGALLAAVVAVASAAAVATHASAASQQAKLTKVTLQSKWVPQAQFAGYYAALAKGFYKQAGLLKDDFAASGVVDVAPLDAALGQ